MIIICEPQCFGFEHAAFNAALLATVRAAYPTEKLLFLGEQEHIQEIKSSLSSTQTSLSNVEWIPIILPPSRLRGMRRYSAEKAVLKTVFEHARQISARAILFCSATEITIFALKQLLNSSPTSYNVQVVLHGVLRSLIEPRWRKPWRWGFSLRQAFSWPHPAGLKYIALSESIRAHALRVQPQLKSSLYAMDMPRLWNPATAFKKPGKSPVRFGYFGTTAKGFQSFYELASNEPTAEFSLIGFLNGRDLTQEYRETVVSGLSTQPLSQAEYSARANRIDYTLWLADPTHYGLTASASFLDALAYLKPVIYLANPYIDSYFEKMGDIGYRCTNLHEMRQLNETLTRSFPTQRYLQQQQTILENRALFDPGFLASTLKKILCAF